jgi:NitT/TauT family transport system substrate-binding protein
MRRASGRLTLLLALALVLTCGAARGQTSPPLTKIVVSWGTLDVANLPIWIAYKAGYFKEHGLDVDLQYQASTIQIASLLSGGVQIAQVGGTNVVSADASGADLIVMGTLSPIFPHLFMVSADIKTPAQLRGKIVGVSKFGDAGDVASRIALGKLGVNEKDVSFVQVGSSANRAAALMNGAVQAGVMIPPMNVPLEAHGVHTLVDLARLRIPAANITIAARKAWVSAHRPQMQGYIDALVEGLHRMRTDKPYAVAVMKQYFESDDDKAMAAACDFYTHEILTTLPYPTVAQFARSLDELAKTNEKVKGFDVAKILDDSFMRSAARAGR